MRTASAPPTAFGTEFERFEARASGTPRWLRDLRRQSMESFLALGLPGRKDEDWLYTDVSPLAKHAFPPAPPPAKAPASLASHRFALGLEGGARIVFLNGRFQPGLSSTDLPGGAVLEPLRAPGGAVRDAVEAGLGTVADGARFPFVALNTAFLEDGALLSLPPGCVIADPVQVLFLHAPGGPHGPDGSAVAVHPRLLVVAGEGAEATVVERYGIDCIGALAGGACLTNAVTEIVVGPNASIRTLRVQREGSVTHHVGFTGVTLARDGRYAATSVSMGGVVDRHELRVDILGEGAECRLDGLYVVTNDEHVDNHVVVHHTVPHGRSAQRYKGILAGRARGAFTGRVVVERDAVKTEATQVNHNLLLSSGAVAETRPQLEIHADDVKCAHGATIGRLDADAIDYLRSRGVGARAARDLLVHAFASEITDAVGDPRLTAGLESFLAARLQAGAGGGAA